MGGRKVTGFEKIANRSEATNFALVIFVSPFIDVLFGFGAINRSRSFLQLVIIRSSSNLLNLNETTPKKAKKKTKFETTTSNSTFVLITTYLRLKHSLIDTKHNGNREHRENIERKRDGVFSRHENSVATGRKCVQVR